MTPDKAVSLANDLECTIATLRAITDELMTAYTDNDYRDYGEPEQDASKPLTLEQVRAVLAEKSRNGHTAKIRELLEKYGAAKLSEIAPAKYADLLAEAEVLSNG